MFRRMSAAHDLPRDFSGALEMLRRLRDPDTGCPWDQEQTPRSLLPHLLEEAHEAAAAIESEDRDAIVDELGDLMLHLAFQIVIAEESGRFDVSDVAGSMIDKMVSRHPHVFGDAEFAGDDHQTMWERLKRREREPELDHVSDVIGDLPEGLPALVRAYRMQQKVATVGFDWPTASKARTKVSEEIEELEASLESNDEARIEEEFGDVLFALVNWGRLLGLHPHTALQRATRKFERRFRRLEALATERRLVLADQELSELDALWNEAKREERAEA